MNKRKLNTVFRIIKIAAKLDYAITNADVYGDCQSCVNYALCEAFGEESAGIWTKHWLKGMNKGSPWKDLDKVYIGHDITEEQAKIIVKILKSYGYKVEPEEYDPFTSFTIKEIPENVDALEKSLKAYLKENYPLDQEEVDGVAENIMGNWYATSFPTQWKEYVKDFMSYL